MSIKWSMVFLAFSGVLAYALIFLGQTQGEDAPAASAAEAVVTDRAAVDTPAPEAPVVAEVVSTSESETPAPPGEPEPPVFENPWQTGVEAWQAGDMELAVQALTASVEERPRSGYRHYLLGLALRRSGETGAAAVELDRSLELAPDAVKTLVAVGRVQLDLEQTAPAREAIDRALELEIDNGDVWHVLGRIEFAEGRFEEAEAAFRRAVDHDRSHAWAWNNLGYLYIQRENFATAADALRHAVESDDPAAVFFNNLGVALERNEALAAAAASYAKAGILGSEPSETNFARVAEILDAREIAYLGYDEVETLGREELLAAITPVTPPAEELAKTEVDSLDTVAEELTQAELLTEPVRW